MASPNSRKGARHERGLGKKLENADYQVTNDPVDLDGEWGHIRDRGYAAMRTPASGSATGRDLPDLLAMQPAMIVHGHNRSGQPILRLAHIYAIEVKSTNDGTVRLSHEEVFALCRYALLAGADPLIAVRPNFRDSRYDRWSFFEPRELTWAEGSRGVTHGMMPGRSFEEVFAP